MVVGVIGKVLMSEVKVSSKMGNHGCLEILLC